MAGARGRHPFGKPLIAFEHRLAMCQLLCADASGWLRTSDIERRLGGAGYTVDTLRALHREWPGHRWTLVVGSDILAELPRWHEVDEVRRLARIVVLHRAGHPAPEAIGPPLADVSSTEVRDSLAQGRGRRRAHPPHGPGLHRAARAVPRAVRPDPHSRVMPKR